MNRYEIYKETDFKWIGEIPVDWELSRVSKFFNQRSEKANDVSYPPLSVTMSGIIDQLSNVAKTNDGDNRKLVKKDDFVINSRSDRKGSSGIAPRDGSVSLINIVLEPQGLDPQFIQHLFKSYYFKEEFFRNGKGIHWDLWTTRWDQFKNIIIPIPSTEEQKLISRYLDKKTVQIDKLIDKIQKKIELLKEQRMSLINQYVTKGLVSNVKMKNSGIKWIGMIPEHWITTKIRFITEDHRQGFYTSDPYDDEGIPILRITDIKDDHSFSYLDSPKYSRSETEINNFYVKDGDFLFPRTGGVGRFGIVDFDFPCIYGSFMIRFRFNTLINKQFMKFFLESSVFIDQVKQEIHGGVNQNVHVENIKNVILFLPSIDEQIDIADYILKDTLSIDNNIKLEKKRINLLKEYRLSLISSAVTGKVRIIEDMV